MDSNPSWSDPFNHILDTGSEWCRFVAEDEKRFAKTFFKVVVSNVC